MKKQLTRAPRKLPTLKLNPAITSLFYFKVGRYISLIDCGPAPLIKGTVAV
ncbi:hypothetical protein [Spiroplasma endosymbiont of Polydrusus formosus]|uniref:hypothetical protein n=1 Tax=Spiroplasma endosymbiont of Polydrusus formosus TaxID=3139326 RepID=UPI0035B554D2